MIRRRGGTTWLALVVAGALAAAGCAELQNGNLAGDLLRAVSTTQTGPLDQQTVAAGLKDALRVGTERAVGATSQPGGFLASELLRIALPKQLAPMANTLRTVGLGSQVEALETAMNRAAEQATGEAGGIFLDAIAGMSLADAVGILNGGPTAATDYFRERAGEALQERFRPIVAQKMGEVGLYNSYTQLVDAYTALPLVSKPDLDLEGYVAQKAQDGLFTTLAAEETRIRENPAARTTELLKQVFGP